MVFHSFFVFVEEIGHWIWLGRDATGRLTQGGSEFGKKGRIHGVVGRKGKERDVKLMHAGQYVLTCPWLTTWESNPCRPPQQSAPEERSISTGSQYNHETSSHQILNVEHSTKGQACIDISLQVRSATKKKFLCPGVKIETIVISCLSAYSTVSLHNSKQVLIVNDPQRPIDPVKQAQGITINNKHCIEHIMNCRAAIADISTGTLRSDCGVSLAYL